MTPSSHARLALAWGMVLLVLARLASAEVVDRVVVVVDDTPILASEVRLAAALEQVDPSPIPFWTASGADTTERLVDATIVRTFAADVSLYQPSRDQVTVRLEALRGAFPTPAAYGAFLDATGLDEAK